MSRFFLVRQIGHENSLSRKALNYLCRCLLLKYSVKFPTIFPVFLLGFLKNPSHVLRPSSSQYHASWRPFVPPGVAPAISKSFLLKVKYLSTFSHYQLDNPRIRVYSIDFSTRKATCAPVFVFIFCIPFSSIFLCRLLLPFFLLLYLCNCEISFISQPLPVYVSTTRVQLSSH